MSLDHINVKERNHNLPQFTFDCSTCQILNIEEIDYEKPSSFDEVAINTIEIRQVRL